MIIMTRILALLTLFLSLPSYSQMGIFGDIEQGAQANTSSAKPLIWQKIEFEEQLTQSLRKNLSVILPEDQFLISVNLKLKSDDKKKKAKKPSRKTASKSKNGDLPGPGGLGAPVLGGDDLMSKLGVGGHVSSPEELEKKDSLFDNISSFNVNLLIDESVGEDREKTARTLLKKILPTFKGTRPRVKVERLAMIDSKAAAEAAAVLKAEQNESTLDILKEFKDPVGRVVALLLFGMVVFVLTFLAVGKMVKLGEAAIAAFSEWTTSHTSEGSGGGAGAGAACGGVGGASVVMAGAVTAAAGDAPGAGGGGGTMTMEMSEGAGVEDEAASAMINSSADKNLAGIDKFRELVEKETKTASLFVRQWLKFKPLGSSDALVVLTRFLHPNDLVKLFDLMTPQERKDMSKMLSAPLSRDALGRADLFLNNQLIMDLIVPKPELESDVQELIFAVTAEEVSSVFSEDKEIAAQVMSLLPSAQIASIAQALEDEVCIELYPLLAKSSVDDAVKNIDSIKAKLNALRGEADISDNPFIESIPEFMPSASSAKELLLYNVLKDSEQWTMIKKLSEQTFPSSLIGDLPEEFLKASFLTLSNPKRAELILSREESERAKFYAAVGEPGKKLRDMLDLEVAEIEKDEEARAELEENKDAIWNNFVLIIRNLTKTDPSFSKASNKVLSEWVERLRTGESKNEDKQAAQFFSDLSFCRNFIFYKS